ncbi:uncharacterized protein LOC111360065 [Spodoptera litura]|uniref:Uncharacterized protein LOC111360065 n=1 Tax=Spodoptera litura TaxID=69820 RepID=A0A9J7EPC1_SPOLT|nr:uncharacterized protein LOC111360065 [Spodoptera litura]
MARTFFVIFALILVLSPCEMSRRKIKDYPTDKQLTLQRKETTPVDFTRLVVMRLVYGFAKVLGFEEPIGEVMNGAFVPPGADDDDFDDDDGDFFDDY